MTAQAKAAARQEARVRRAEAHTRLADAAPLLLSGHFLDSVPLPSGAVVAGYAAIGTELDPLPLLKALAKQGFRVALPRIAGKDMPLLFHEWPPGKGLMPGPHGTREPDPASPILEPDIVLVPLLAFDREGKRLGYGGGYYDRTLASLRQKNKSVLAVGVAFSAQEAQDLPTDEFDARLDMVVTENGLRIFPDVTAGEAR